MEVWCELIAALKLRTTNLKGRHLSTGRAIELLVEHGVETPDGLLRVPPGLLTRTTVDRYLRIWGLDKTCPTRQPSAVRFQADGTERSVGVGTLAGIPLRLRRGRDRRPAPPVQRHGAEGRAGVGAAGHSADDCDHMATDDCERLHLSTAGAIWNPVPINRSNWIGRTSCEHRRFRQCLGCLPRINKTDTLIGADWSHNECCHVCLPANPKNGNSSMRNTQN
ncbi:hypothetical protein CCP1ISM_480003 [Azospirillaceae bacterium]